MYDQLVKCSSLMCHLIYDNPCMTSLQVDHACDLGMRMSTVHDEQPLEHMVNDTRQHHRTRVYVQCRMRACMPTEFVPNVPVCAPYWEQEM